MAGAALDAPAAQSGGARDGSRRQASGGPSKTEIREVQARIGLAPGTPVSGWRMAPKGAQRSDQADALGAQRFVP